MPSTKARSAPFLVPLQTAARDSRRSGHRHGFLSRLSPAGFDPGLSRKETGACGLLRRHPLMVRFSPGFPGLAPEFGEPPPRNLNQVPAETHTLSPLFNCDPDMMYQDLSDSSKPGLSGQAPLRYPKEPLKRLSISSSIFSANSLKRSISLCASSVS